MQRRLANWLDGAALGASWACLAHCLLLPLAFSLLPGLAGILAVPEWFHAAMLMVALPISMAALLPVHAGHSRRVPMALALVGFIALGGGLLAGRGPMVETGLTIVGSLTLAAAHVTNWRQRRAAA